MHAPTDRQLANIDDAASGILNQLRIMRYAAVADLPMLRERLREMLADYAARAMSAARTK